MEINKWYGYLVVVIVIYLLLKQHYVTVTKQQRPLQPHVVNTSVGKGCLM